MPAKAKFHISNSLVQRLVDQVAGIGSIGRNRGTHEREQPRDLFQLLWFAGESLHRLTGQGYRGHWSEKSASVVGKNRANRVIARWGGF
jgi:hypothetical protein